jgi:hypothetical protein
LVVLTAIVTTQDENVTSQSEKIIPFEVSLWNHERALQQAQGERPGNSLSCCNDTRFPRRGVRA